VPEAATTAIIYFAPAETLSFAILSFQTWQKVSCVIAITGVVAAATTSFFERMIFHEHCGISIGKKLIQICDAFSAYRYALPDMADAPAVARLFQQTAQELVDSKTVLLKIYDTWYRLCQLHTISVAKWTWTVLQEKEVYHTVNTFQADVSRLLRGIDWIIAESVDAVVEEVTLSMEDHLCLNFFDRHDEKSTAPDPYQARTIFESLTLARSLLHAFPKEFLKKIPKKTLNHFHAHCRDAKDDMNTCFFMSWMPRFFSPYILHTVLAVQ
jgi:hypothetical protein